MNRPKSAAKPYLEVKNWKDLQNYGETRNAIWIKLYARLLDDVDGFLELPEATQCHLVKIWLVALRQKNRIPFRLAWIEAEIYAQSHVDFELLIGQGWLIPQNVSEVEVEAAIEETRSRPLLSSVTGYHHELASQEKRREEERYPSISPVTGSVPSSPTGPRLGGASGSRTSPAREAART